MLQIHADASIETTLVLIEIHGEENGLVNRRLMFEGKVLMTNPSKVSLRSLKL